MGSIDEWVINWQIILAWLQILIVAINFVMSKKGNLSRKCLNTARAIYYYQRWPCHLTVALCAMKSQASRTPAPSQICSLSTPWVPLSKSSSQTPSTNTSNALEFVDGFTTAQEKKGLWVYRVKHDGFYEGCAAKFHVLHHNQVFPAAMVRNLIPNWSPCQLVSSLSSTSWSFILSPPR